ncbi:MAG: hypothetical protein ACK5LP_08400 [Campylobacteraceae bacterium]
MYITLEEYNKYFNGKYKFYFCDCEVRRKELFSFILEPLYTTEQYEEEEKNNWDPDLRPKSIVTFNRTPDKEKMWSGGVKYNWNGMVLGVAQKPLNQSITIEKYSTYPSLDHKSYIIGSGPAYLEILAKPYEGLENTADGKVIRGHVAKLKTIDGYLYLCGGGRTISKRVDKGKWKTLNDLIPREYGEDGGFSDIDGFGENDIYAVGGRGDVLHFNGKECKQINFPSNKELKSVCCAGDGNVYINGFDGIFVGRDDKWKNIGRVYDPEKISDIIWYEDMVWMTNGYRIWNIKNGVMIRDAIVPKLIEKSTNLSISANDGILLIAGMRGAVFKEDGKWQTLVDFDEMKSFTCKEV